MQPGIDYDPLWFALSIVIAIAAAGAALWITRRLRREARGNWRMRVFAALVMGFAIVGMHYTGMAAAQFPDGSFCGATLDGLKGNGLDNLVLITTLELMSVTRTCRMFLSS